MLVAGLVGAYVSRYLRIPKVVGYLLAGAALGAGLRWLFDYNDDAEARAALDASAEPLKTIKNVALGLILFTIGGVFDKNRLRLTGPRIARLALVEAVTVVVLVSSACFASGLLDRAGMSFADLAVLSLLLAIVALATAPAATVLVLQEYEAKGPITNTILGLTGINNVLALVGFYSVFLALASIGAIPTRGAVTQSPLLALFAMTAGSIVLGVAAGTLLSIVYARLALSETLLIFFTLFILLGTGENWLLTHKGVSFNFLLTAMVIGAVFANLTVDAPKLEATLRVMGTPLYAAFFVLAGYGLHLKEVPALGITGVAFLIARFGSKTLAGRWGGRWVGLPPQAGVDLGSAMLCQAAIAIGLSAFAEHYWDHPAASRFATVLLGSVVIFECIGPLLLKRCVVAAGEVKAVTLLRRSGGAADEGGAVTRLTLESLGRLVGWKRSPLRTGAESLEVRHIMRRNVETLRASEPFDDVLHFIERSTHAHFPVVHDDGTFCGVIHFHDVRDVIYDPVLAGLLTAADLSDQAAVFVPIDLPLDHLMEEFRRHNVSVLPVVESLLNQRLVGMVEQRDLLRTVRQRAGTL